ncbi:hypothetical protein KSF78_0001639 [Schistosoma japonicum]|nr:hypothetical protein KSF78_0001639 [Schistosoma japonicum]
MGIKTERLYQKKNSAKCPFDVVLKCRRFENTVYRINVGGSNRKITVLIEVKSCYDSKKYWYNLCCWVGYNRHPNGICSVEGCSCIVGNYDVVPFATAKESPVRISGIQEEIYQLDIKVHYILSIRSIPIWSIQGRSYVSRKCIPSTYYSPSIQLGS